MFVTFFSKRQLFFWLVNHENLHRASSKQGENIRDVKKTKREGTWLEIGAFLSH